MKAREKARERRFPPVATLTADIQRHIEHRPVLASPPSRLYRTRKFLRRHRLPAFGMVGALGFMALIGATIWSFVGRDSSPRPSLTEKRTVVLADFVNGTGDPGFNGAPRQFLAAAFGNSPTVALLPDARVTRTLRFMMRPPDAKLTPDIAAEICERTASAAVVEGSITSAGGEYVLDLTARNCQTGDIL